MTNGIHFPLYLISPHGSIPRIEEHAEDPFPIRDTLVSIGYATREELFWREGLTQCVDCKGRIWPKFACEAELKALQVCHVCWCKRKAARKAA